jgi:hypothetical protein
MSSAVNRQLRGLGEGSGAMPNEHTISGQPSIIYDQLCPDLDKPSLTY